MLDYSPALMTDMYEYTMLDACLRDGTANRKCVFEIFTRHLPLGRHYGVAAGQGRILDALENFHLDDNDLKFLADRKVVGRRCRSPRRRSRWFQRHGQSAGRANVWFEGHWHGRALLHAGT